MNSYSKLANYTKGKNIFDNKNMELYAQFLVKQSRLKISLTNLAKINS